MKHNPFLLSLWFIFHLFRYKILKRIYGKKGEILNIGYSKFSDLGRSVIIIIIIIINIMETKRLQLDSMSNFFIH